ncbi:ribonuclease H-like domain-containing protein [Tanacetum coccineum]
MSGICSFRTPAVLMLLVPLYIVLLSLLVKFTVVPNIIILLACYQSVALTDHEDLETSLMEYDLEETGLEWHVAMISIRRMKSFTKRLGILLESVESREIKIIGGEMLGTLEIRMGAKLERRRTLKHWWTIVEEGVDWDQIKFMKIDLDDKTDVLTYHKKLLAEAMKEKEDLKAKVEKWHNSSKNLGKLLNTQMSANDKFGLGYGDHRYDGILSYENEVLQSVFMKNESELEKQPLYDRFVTPRGMHSQPSESKTQTSDFDTCESNISIETPEIVSEPVVNEPNVGSQPKVWTDDPIIEDYESDSDDYYVSKPTKEHEQPSFDNKQVKTPRETVKNQFTHSKNPKVDKKGLGYGFTIKACFVCGSLGHLIRDCDFHENRMAKQVELNKKMAVLTRTGKIPVNTARASGTNTVNTARHNVNRQAVPTNAAMKVNTVKPIVNNARPKGGFHKSVSPFRKPFNRTTALRTNFL